MSCLDSSAGGGRYRVLKGIFLALFSLCGTQLYPLMFHFFRLISYNLLDRQSYPPKVFPKQTSWIGEETLQSDDLHFDDNSSSVHTVQVVVAALSALLTGGTGFMAICREKIFTMKIWSVVMMLITFITGLGSFTLPNLVSLKQLAMPLLGGGLSSLVTFVYSLLAQKRHERDPYSRGGGGYRDYNSSMPSSINNNNNNVNSGKYNAYMDPYSTQPIPKQQQQTLQEQPYYDALNYNPQYDSPYNPQLNSRYNPQKPY